MNAMPSSDSPAPPPTATLWPRRLIPILTLGGGLAGLAFWGAGIFPGSLFLVATLFATAAAAHALIIPRENRFPARPGVEIALLAIILWVAFSLIPLPPALVAVLDGPRAELASAVDRLGRQWEAIPSLAATPFPFAGPTLTLNRAGTLRGLMLIIAAAMAAGLAAGIEPRLKPGFLRFLLVLGVTVAVAGFHSQWTFPQGHRLWWIFNVPPSQPGPVGGFVNRNHFAGFTALFCPLAFALTVGALRERRFLAAGAAGLSLLVLIGVVVASLSRGALLAAGTGLAATALLTLRRPHRWPVGLILSGVALTLIGLWLFLPPVRARLAEGRSPGSVASVQSRLAQWRDGFRVIRAHPVAGVGLNAFGMVYPQYRTSASSGTLRYAENEYVQTLAETGLIGLTLIGLLALALHRRRRIVHHSVPPATDLDIAVGGALVVAATHALFDFPLRIPLYTLTVAALAGLLFQPVPLRWPGFLGRLDHGPALALLPAIACLILIIIHPSHLKAHRLDHPAYLHHAATTRDRLQSIIGSPPNAQAWFFLGWELSALSPQTHPDEYRLAERCVDRAAQLDPRNYRIWRHLAALRHALGDPAGAVAAWEQARTLRPWLGPYPYTP